MDMRLDLKERLVQREFEDQRVSLSQARRIASESQGKVAHSDRQFTQLVTQLRDQRNQKRIERPISADQLQATMSTLNALKAKAKLQAEIADTSSLRLQHLQKHLDLIGELRQQSLRLKKGQEENLFSEEVAELKANQQRFLPVELSTVGISLDDSSAHLHHSSQHTSPASSSLDDVFATTSLNHQQQTPAAAAVACDPMGIVTDLTGNAPVDLSTNSKAASSESAKPAESRPTLPHNQGLQATLTEQAGVKTIDFAYLFQGHELRVQLQPQAKDSVMLNVESDALLTRDQLRRALASVKRELAAKGFALSTRTAHSGGEAND